MPELWLGQDQFALSIEELGDDDPLIVVLTKMAQNDTED